MVAAGLRCRGLSPFSFIQSQFTPRFLPTFSLHTSARCTLQLGKLTSWQGNKYCDATLCVCFFLSGEKKKKRTDENQQKQILRNLMQSAFFFFISLSARFLSCHSGPSLASPPTFRQDEKQSRGGVKGPKTMMGAGGSRRAWWQLSLSHMAVFLLTHTHTQPLRWGLAPTRCREIRRMQRGIEGGSPRLSGMTEFKAFKKEELKDFKSAAHFVPRLSFVDNEMGARGGETKCGKKS